MSDEAINKRRQKIHWSKQKGQKDKQWSTKHRKLKIMQYELIVGCSGRVGISGWYLFFSGKQHMQIW